MLGVQPQYHLKGLKSGRAASEDCILCVQFRVHFKLFTKIIHLSFAINQHRQSAAGLCQVRNPDLEDRKLDLSAPKQPVARQWLH